MGCDWGLRGNPHYPKKHQSNAHNKYFNYFMDKILLKVGNINNSLITIFVNSNKILLSNWVEKRKKYLIYNQNFSEKINSFSLHKIKKIKHYTNIFPKENSINWNIKNIENIKKNNLIGGNFNIFYLLKDNLGLNIHETLHSKLIKFLLDEHEMHGQGNLFLIEFLKMFNVESPEQGTWIVTAEIGRIDILLERNYPESIIVIENKSNGARDQPNQLYRYWFRKIYLQTNQIDKNFYETKKANYKILYLVSDYNKNIELQSITKPTDQAYHNLPDNVPMSIDVISFQEEITNWLNNCIEILYKDNHRVREYLIQYKSFCSTL